MDQELTQWCRDRFGNDYRIPTGGRPRNPVAEDLHVVVGQALVPFQWRLDGWPLPGGSFVRDREAAIRAAELIDQEMRK